MNRRRLFVCLATIIVAFLAIVLYIVLRGGGPTQSGTIRVGILKHESALPFYVGKELGFFVKNGINVEFVELPPGDHMPALLADRVDIITPTSFTVLFGVMNQHPTLLYAVFPGAEVADGPPVYGLVVRNDFSGTGIKDLLGGVVMAINPYTQVNVQTIFSSAGFPKDKWPQIKVAAREAALAAVSDGKAAAAIMDQPALAVALVSGKFKLLESNPRARHIGSPYWSGSGAVKRSKWEKRHGDLQKLMKGYDDALLWIRSHDKEAHIILAESLGLDPNVAGLCGGYYFPLSSETVPTDGIRDTSDALVKAGLLKEPVSMLSFFPPLLHGQK